MKFKIPVMKLTSPEAMGRYSSSETFSHWEYVDAQDVLSHLDIPRAGEWIYYKDRYYAVELVIRGKLGIVVLLREAVSGDHQSYTKAWESPFKE